PSEGNRIGPREEEEKMTRETKAGLIVSCSFVCLVGIVLFAKWRERGTPSVENTEQQLASLPPDPTPIQDNPKNEFGAKNKKTFKERAALPPKKPPPPLSNTAPNAKTATPQAGKPAPATSTIEEFPLAGAPSVSTATLAKDNGPSNSKSNPLEPKDLPP